MMNEAAYSLNQLNLFEECEISPMESTPDSLFGKTFSAHFPAIKDAIFKPCSRKSDRPMFQCLVMGDGLPQDWQDYQNVTSHGEHLTLSFGESPSVAVGSSLSRILQPKSDVPQKCYLSSRACQGILRRAARRGKKLPPSLETALKRQAGAENTINRHAVFSENEKTYSVQAIGHIVESEKSSTLAARDYKSSRNFVEYSKIDKQQEVPLYDISHRNDGVREIPKGACNTLAARRGTGGGNVAVLNEADRQKTDDAQTVRRLTVTECERLQGLPDGYTDVSVNGKPASERDRLMALGNGMAQPCADYVIQRIVDEVGKTYI